MEYRPQIPQSALDSLADRVRKGKYAYYLKSIEIQKLRGLEETSIQFDFPVTAIIGPNGSGKSTVLGAAGLTCKDLKPRQFFAKSGKYDETMKAWKAEYQLIRPQGKDSAHKSIGKTTSMTASYARSKWNRNASTRPVKLIGIGRTIPAAEKKSLNNFVGSKFEAKYEDRLSEEAQRAVARILGKNAEAYIKIYNEESDPSVKGLSDKSIFVHNATDDSGLKYSEFHFGAGEASIIGIVEQIESTGENALILIEEIENGLHPVATRRLVEYLIDVAKRKSVQVIFTTHSNDAIAPLPSDAVWSVSNGKLNQGKLDVASLRVLTGEVQTSCVIFTEDDFSRKLAHYSLRHLCRSVNGINLQVDLSQIQIHGVGGEGNVKSYVETANKLPHRSSPHIGLLDGDMKKNKYPNPMITFGSESFSQLCYCPGTLEPEIEIYDQVRETFGDTEFNDSVAKLTILLTGDSVGQETVRQAIEQVSLTTTDHHLLFSRLGDELNFLDEDHVSHAFLTRWCLMFPERCEQIWANSLDALPWVEV